MDDFRDWIGRTETVADELSASHVRGAAALFDDAATDATGGASLPLLWHWFFFAPRAMQQSLDADGHPQRGGFMPPVPYPRRMFAGARVELHQPLRIGRSAERHGVIRDVVHKSGRSGNLAFVTVAYRYVQDGAVCIEEVQDIVYRERSALVAAPIAAPTSIVAPPRTVNLPDGAWTRTVHPDSRMLFRFSALTFNAHRIHYDREYAVNVEGYPGLVIHGPLTAMLLLSLARERAPHALTRFSFRGLAPLFDLAPVRLVATPAANAITLRAEAPDGTPALEATAGWE